jgi:hypothetical protein
MKGTQVSKLCATTELFVVSPEPVVLSVDHMALRGPHRISRGPLDHEGKWRSHSSFWVGHRNIIDWIKYFKFKIESSASFSPTSPAAQNGKFYFIPFSKLYLLECGISWGDICCQKYVIALMLWREMMFAYHWPHYNRRSKNNCKFSASLTNTQNIMPIINRIFLLV